MVPGLFLRILMSYMQKGELNIGATLGKALKRQAIELFGLWR